MLVNHKCSPTEDITTNNFKRISKKFTLIIPTTLNVYQKAHPRSVYDMNKILSIPLIP